MRIQAYTENNLVFVGPESHSFDLSAYVGSGVIQFESTDSNHPLLSKIKHLIPPEKIVTAWDAAYAPMGPRRRGLCWAKTTYIEGRMHNEFHFDFIGDVLPWHTHDDKTVHTSEVKIGSFDLETKDGHRVINVGDFIDWEPGEWHGFKALEANSVLLNIVKKAAEEEAIMFGFGKKKDPEWLLGRTERKPRPVPVAVDPGVQRRQDLWDYVEKFVREQGLKGPADAWNPLVGIVMPGFVNGCADIVGYNKKEEV